MQATKFKTSSRGTDGISSYNYDEIIINNIGKKVVYIFTLRNLKYMYKNVCMDQNSM